MNYGIKLGELKVKDTKKSVDPDASNLLLHDLTPDDVPQSKPIFLFQISTLEIIIPLQE